MVVGWLRSRRLPEEVWSGSVGLAVQLIGKVKWAPGNTPEVIAHSQPGDGKHQTDWNNRVDDRILKRRPIFPQHTRQEWCSSRQTQHHSLVRTAICEYRDPQPHQQSVTKMRLQS